MRSLRSPHLHAGVCAATIVVLMMLPAEALPKFGHWLPHSLDQWIDKIQHIIAFMVMVVLLSRSLRERQDIQRPILMAAILTLGFSFLLEALQALIPWRTFAPADLIADTVGVLIAVPFARTYVRLTQSTRINS